METQPQTEPAILCTRIEQNGTAWAEIVLNRPEKGNALTLPMLQQLESIAAGTATDPALRAVVIRARGRFFCTGGDIEAWGCLLYTSPSPRDGLLSRMPSSA